MPVRTYKVTKFLGKRRPDGRRVGKPKLFGFAVLLDNGGDPIPGEEIFFHRNDAQSMAYAHPAGGQPTARFTGSSVGNAQLGGLPKNDDLIVAEVPDDVEPGCKHKKASAWAYKSTFDAALADRPRTIPEAIRPRPNDHRTYN